MGGVEPCPHCSGTGYVHRPDTFWYTNSTANTFPALEYSWFGYEKEKHHSFQGQGNWGWRHFKGKLMDAIEFIAPFISFILPPRRRYDYRSDPRWKSERWKAKT